VNAPPSHALGASPESSRACENLPPGARYSPRESLLTHRSLPPRAGVRAEANDKPQCSWVGVYNYNKHPPPRSIDREGGDPPIPAIVRAHTVG